jgi:hypothetical protein
VVGLVNSFNFAIGGRSIAIGGLEDEVKFVVEQFTELSRAGKSTVFVSSDGENFLSLIT